MPREDVQRQKAVRFLIWIYIFSVVMIFAGLTSAVLVGRPDLIKNNKWQFFDLPIVFWASTAVILLSSLTLYLAGEAAKKNQFQRIIQYLMATLVLGILFLFCQVLGYISLVKGGIYLVGSNSGQFLYVLTGMHAAHLLGGLGALVYSLVKSFRYLIHKDNLLGFQITSTYWHALDVIWVYLFLFLYLTYS
jgi:cytochrome c oxidase subunit III